MSSDKMFKNKFSLYLDVISIRKNNIYKTEIKNSKKIKKQIKELRINLFEF